MKGSVLRPLFFFCLLLFATWKICAQTETLFDACSRLEDDIMAENVDHEKAVHDFLKFIEEYKSTDSWAYFVVQHKEFSDVMDEMQSETFSLLNCEIGGVKSFSHLVRIEQCTRYIYDHENEILHHATFTYIVLIVIVIVLLISMAVMLAFYVMVRQKTVRIERERERKDLIENVTSMVKDNERNRIYRDLHDTVSQNLGAISILFGQLAPYIKDTEDARSLSEKITSLNRMNIADIRSIIRNASPVNIETEDFKLVLSDLCTDFSSYRNIPCKFFVKDYDSPSMPSGLNSLSAKKKLHCYRIVQEAMNNAARHASPSQVSVIIRCTQTSVIFFITDDGHGFNYEKVFIDDSHLGLRGMHSRATEIGATLSISSDEDGTEIRLEVPYE